MATPFIGSSKERYRQYSHPVKPGRLIMTRHPVVDRAILFTRTPDRTKP